MYILPCVHGQYVLTVGIQHYFESRGYRFLIKKKEKEKEKEKQPKHSFSGWLWKKQHIGALFAILCMALIKFHSQQEKRDYWLWLPN